MSLVILTKSPQSNILSKEFFWCMFRQALNIKRGPDAVTASIFRGLDEIGYNYLCNPKSEQIKQDDVILVNGSIDALKWAIGEKRNGKFSRLITGPNLVITPNDYGGIINSSEIDMILQPSDWVRDFYISVNPRLLNKIKVWPAGVAIPPYSENKNKKILVYIKNHLNDEQLKIIENVLAKWPHKYIYYGRFNQMEYFEDLNNSQAMLYFSFSESQGLALQEAWARNVPTLVWDRGIWQYKKYIWHAKNISSPYLVSSCGLTFSDFGELLTVFRKFLDEINQYHPREYILNKLSDKKSVEILLNTIGVV